MWELGEYWVASSIIDVESVVDWYYISCKSNSCKRKVSDRGELIGVSAGDLKAKYLEGNASIPVELGCLRGLSMLFPILMKKDQVESYYSACLGFAGMRKCLHIQHSASLLSVYPVRDDFGDNGVFVDVEADSGDFCSSGDEECVEDKSFSQGLDVQSSVGLEDVE
nr:replication protein A 70 kDa DNA-binding subunit B-like [Ipomoea batatas]